MMSEPTEGPPATTFPPGEAAHRSSEEAPARRHADPPRVDWCDADR